MCQETPSFLTPVPWWQSTRWPTHCACQDRSNPSSPPAVTRMKQEGVSYGTLRTAVGEARHLASDKLSLVIYSRSSERGKCNNFFSTLGHFPLCFPLGEVWTRFYLERCTVTFSILLHLLIVLAAPGAHFQDAPREGGLLAAAVQLTASGQRRVLIDGLWHCALSVSLFKKCDGFGILLGPIDFNMSIIPAFIGTWMLVADWWSSWHLFVSTCHHATLSTSPTFLGITSPDRGKPADSVQSLRGTASQTHASPRSRLPLVHNYKEMKLEREARKWGCEHQHFSFLKPPRGSSLAAPAGGGTPRASSCMASAAGPPHRKRAHWGLWRRQSISQESPRVPTLPHYA